MKTSFEKFNVKSRQGFKRSPELFRLFAREFYSKQTDIFKTGDFAQSSCQSPVAVDNGTFPLTEDHVSCIRLSFRGFRSSALSRFEFLKGQGSYFLNESVVDNSPVSEGAFDYVPF
jgi:hypothetical protein